MNLRDIEIRSSAEDLHKKFEDLCEPALGHVFADLSRSQSEQILPQAENTDGMRVHVVLFGTRMYTTSLGPEDSGLIYVLDEHAARLSRYIPRNGRGPFGSGFKVTDLVREDADEKDRNLQGLRFGHRLVDALLEAKQISPEAFSYI